MNNVTKKVLDDVYKTCSFLTSAAAFYIAAYSVETRVFGTNHLGTNSFGKKVIDFDNGKKPKDVN